MKRFVAAMGLVLLACCPVASAATGVRIGGMFYQADSSMDVTQVEVGQEVDLIVRVTDISDSPGGVMGGYVDVSWDSTVMTLQDDIDNDEATTDDIAALFGDPWTDFFLGTQPVAGTLTGVAAGLAPPFDGKLSGAAPIEYFVLRFKAATPGQANLTLVGRDFGVYNSQDVAESYEWVNPSLLVVDAGGTGPKPDPNDPNSTTGTSDGCFCPGGLLGMVMAVGCAGIMGRRRR